MKIKRGTGLILVDVLILFVLCLWVLFWKPAVVREGLADPWARHHVILRQVDGLVQRRRAVALDPLRGLLGQFGDELFQYHLVDNVLDVASVGHQPSAARVPELLRHDEGSAGLFQAQGSEPLAMLFRGPADPLKNGAPQVFIDQEILDWQLVGGYLRLPR